VTTSRVEAGVTIVLADDGRVAAARSPRPPSRFGKASRPFCSGMLGGKMAKNHIMHRDS